MSEQPHIMVVEGQFYEDIVAELARGAIEELEKTGATYDRLSVPGAFEVPAAIAMAVRSMEFYAGRRRFDGYVALGCVIRGETSHYDHICVESARALQDLACRYCLALGNGILTVENREQADVRAAVDGLNKGGAAAYACLRMIGIKTQLHLYPR